MSHLRPVSSTDGIRFREEAGYPPLTGSDRYEAYGIEDCRVTQIGTQYYLTYTAVSANGVAVRMRSTSEGHSAPSDSSAPFWTVSPSFTRMPALWGSA